MSWSEIVLDLGCSLQPLTALAIRRGEDTDTEQDHVARRQGRGMSGVVADKGREKGSSES